MRRRHERWRGALLRCLAAAEAIIDFGEDEDIAPDVAADVRARVAAVRAELARHVSGGRRCAVAIRAAQPFGDLCTWKFESLLWRASSQIQSTDSSCAHPNAEEE